MANYDSTKYQFKMRARPLLLACLTLEWLSISSAGAAEFAYPEARAIFLEVFKGKTFSAKALACQVSTDWVKDTIPESIGRQYFGLTIHADLAAPENPEAGESVLRDAVPDRSQRCSDYEAERYYAAQLEGKEVGTKIGYFRESSTFPVFNHDYSKAIIIFGGWLGSMTQTASGPKHGSASGSTFFEYFVKRRGVWRLVKKEIDGQT